MAKTMIRAVGELAGLALLFTLSILFAPAFPAAEGASTTPGTVTPPPPVSDTRMLVVGSVVLVIIIGIAAAVLWYASRHRGPLE